MRVRFVGFAIVAALAGQAAAQEAAKPAAEEAKPISRTEISNELDADYADLDGDKDGKVTPQEINSRLVKSAEAKVDVLRKARDEAFARLDTDKDGAISRAEFDSKAPLPTIKDADAKPFLDQFDADKDGYVWKDEFRAPTLANFTKLDANKDGTLSLAEQKARASAASAAKKAPTVKKTPAITR